MALEEEKAKKLQALLAALPANIRLALSQMIAEARSSGHSDPVFELLSQFLESPAPAEELPPEKPFLEPFALFKQALKPFLIEEVLQRKVPGRVCEQALRPIWTWLSSDLARVAIEAYSSAASGNADEREESLLAAIARAMRQILESTRGNDDQRRRIIGQLSGARNFEEFEDIAIILSRSREITRFSAILTEAESATEAALAPVLARAIVELARIEPRLPFYAAVLIYSKLGAAGKAVRIAVTGTGSEDVRVISTSPFAALVEVILAETERFATCAMSELKSLKSNGVLAPAIREFAMSSRHLRAVLNLDQTTHEWSKRVTDMRTRLSEEIARELNELPRLIRASVKTLRAFDQRKLGLPDSVDVERCCLLIELLNAARLSSTELGVNETILRVQGDTEAYLDHTARILMEDTRNALGEQRNTVRAYSEVAVRLTELLHGTARAATLRRSLAMISNSAEPAAKAAR